MKKTLTIIIATLLALVLVSCGKKKMKPIPEAKVPEIDEWVAVWADEFDGDKLDLTKWRYEINGFGGYNNELQYYTGQNAIVSDGTLKIVGKKEDFLGKKYTSSRITTQNLADFKYGRFVMSAKMPSGRGTWPAFWMMPTHSKYGNWPNSGEIDILEYVGYERNVIHSAVHMKNYNHIIGNQQKGQRTIKNAETEFHTYELIWQPGLIETFVDSQKIATFRYTSAFNEGAEYKDAYPFDQEFYMILNLAIGGDWGGSMGVDETIFPTTYEIDYVRVYQKDYGYYDKEKPSSVSNLRASKTLKNSIVWNESKDDMGVEFYNVYIDGEIFTTSNLSQVTLKGLDKNTEYEIIIEAVDFVGNKSPKSSPLKYTFK